MDYEEKYKEALERMRNVIIPPETKEGLQGLKETVFPELRESEDERIRKMLVEQMEGWKKCAEDNNVEQDVKDASAAIAWLEKQKEQKPAGWSEEESAIIDGIIQDVRNAKMRAQEDVDYPASKEELDAYDEELDFLNRLKSLRPQPNDANNEIAWKKYEDGHRFDSDTVVIGLDRSEPRLVRCAVSACYGIAVKDLMKLPFCL